MIRLTGIARTFLVGGEEVHALRTVDLEILHGEYLSIMGPSGSGKSTLLNIIGLLDRPDAGSYELDQRKVTALSDDQLAQVRRDDRAGTAGGCRGRADSYLLADS